MSSPGDLTRFDPAVRRRIETTTSIRVTDRMEKVARAGQIQTVDGQDVQVMHNGVLVEKDCYGGPWMTEIISRLRGHHEPQEEVAFAEILDTLQGDTAAPVMIELGAYWAYYSLWFASQIPAGTVVLVEPDPVNLAVGIRNFALNGLTARAAVPAAVGPVHDSSIEIACESDGVVRPIRGVTLEGLMAEQDLARVDLVLCDVQGAEVDMLAGAERVIRDGRTRFMVISTHWSQTDPLIHQTCRARVQALGGHIISEHSLTESCSGDGLIVVSFDARDRAMHIEVPVIRARDSEVGELEWVIARRMGWRGILWGVADLIGPSARQRLGSSRLGAALHRRLIARRATV
jgi:FkbM family methyltransferase